MSEAVQILKDMLFELREIKVLLIEKAQKNKVIENGLPIVPRIRNEKEISLNADTLEILKFLNEKTGRNYKPVKANLEFIKARLKDGATVTTCRQVIARKCRDWLSDPKMSAYLRPATLFNATKFAQYEGELVKAGS